MKDYEVMLGALSKERDSLHDQLMQIDRIIKRIKTGEYLASNEITTLEIIPSNLKEPVSFSNTANIKVQAIRLFDIIGHAAKLKEINTEYTKQTGKVFNLREVVRTLHSSKILYMVKEKSLERAKYWVKREWVNNGQLLDQFKPEGFDLLYKAEDLEYL